MGDRFTGHDLALCWAYAAGVMAAGSVWLEADYRTFGPTEAVNDANSTAGDDVYAGHLPTFTDASAALTMVGTSNSGTLHWAQIAPRTQGTVYWYPEGTASSKPKHYAPAYIQKRDRTYPYNDVVAVNVTFQFQGAPVDGVV